MQWYNTEKYHKSQENPNTLELCLWKDRSSEMWINPTFKTPPSQLWFLFCVLFFVYWRVEDPVFRLSLITINDRKIRTMITGWSHSRGWTSDHTSQYQFITVDCPLIDVTLVQRFTRLRSNNLMYIICEHFELFV